MMKTLKKHALGKPHVLFEGDFQTSGSSWVRIKEAREHNILPMFRGPPCN